MAVVSVRTSAASSGPPRASEELLRRSRARGGLLGELVQIEPFFANPQVEVKQDDGDGRDRRDQRAEQRPADLNERRLKVAGAEDGRDHPEKEAPPPGVGGLQDGKKQQE